MTAPSFARSPLLWIGAAVLIFLLWAWGMSWRYSSRVAIDLGGAKVWRAGQTGGRAFLTRQIGGKVSGRATAVAFHEPREAYYLMEPVIFGPAPRGLLGVHDRRPTPASPVELRTWSFEWSFVIALHLAGWGGLIYWRYRRIRRAIRGC
ncbi:hypothetical protein [Luteolibacter sp. Populi]|uniref:hypothetical protein n=1 Tax=Luteolibacter sp. Populi TaxID=3230487 RepID=UPI003466F94C